jgi:hypothetical protein
MCKVLHVAQEMGWACEETNTENSSKYGSSIKLMIADTNYYLQVLPPIIAGTFCKLNTSYVIGDNYLLMMFDVCA